MVVVGGLWPISNDCGVYISLFWSVDPIVFYGSNGIGAMGLWPMAVRTIADLIGAELMVVGCGSNQRN